MSSCTGQFSWEASQPVWDKYRFEDGNNRKYCSPELGWFISSIAENLEAMGKS